MSEAPTRSIGRRALKFLLGHDQPSFVAAAAGVIIALGILAAFHIVYSGTRAPPPLWQTIGMGLVLGLFLLPFFFMAISRAALFVSHWEALALIGAAGLCPLVMRTLAGRVDAILFIAISLAVLAGPFLITRAIVKRHR